MEISAALAAELTSLTTALDDPSADIARSLLNLAAGARAAVASYCGLTVVMASTDSPIAFSAFEPGVEIGDVRSSLMLLAPSGGDDSDPSITLILLADAPGAFVDLAADLSWMTGRPLGEVVVDQHLQGVPDGRGAHALHQASVLNQAIGVLIGRGYSPEEAVRQLDARAIRTQTDRHDVAALILDTAQPEDGGV